MSSFWNIQGWLCNWSTVGYRGLLSRLFMYSCVLCGVSDYVFCSIMWFVRVCFLASVFSGSIRFEILCTIRFFAFVDWTVIWTTIMCSFSCLVVHCGALWHFVVLIETIFLERYSQHGITVNTNKGPLPTKEKTVVQFRSTIKQGTNKQSMKRTKKWDRC